MGKQWKQWQTLSLWVVTAAVKLKDTRRSNQSIQKEIKPEYLLGRLMLMLKLQCFGQLMQRRGKDTGAGKHWRLLRKKGVADDEMVRWHHWLSRHEFGQILEDSAVQKGLACCSPGDCKESDMAEWTTTPRNSTSVDLGRGSKSVY